MKHHLFFLQLLLDRHLNGNGVLLNTVSILGWFCISHVIYVVLSIKICWYFNTFLCWYICVLGFLGSWYIFIHRCMDDREITHIVFNWLTYDEFPFSLGFVRSEFVRVCLCVCVIEGSTWLASSECASSGQCCSTQKERSLLAQPELTKLHEKLFKKNNMGLFPPSYADICPPTYLWRHDGRAAFIKMFQ